VLFTFLVPVVNLTSVSCPDCDIQHRHPFEGLVQIAETSLAAVSFLSLSHIVRRHGLRRTLLLDRIMREAVEVRTGYESELHVSATPLFKSLPLSLTLKYLESSLHIFLNISRFQSSLGGTVFTFEYSRLMLK